MKTVRQVIEEKLVNHGLQEKEAAEVLEAFIGSKACGEEQAKSLRELVGGPVGAPTSVTAALWMPIIEYAAAYARKHWPRHWYRPTLSTSAAGLSDEEAVQWIDTYKQNWEEQLLRRCPGLYARFDEYIPDPGKEGDGPEPEEHAGERPGDRPADPSNA